MLAHFIFGIMSLFILYTRISSKLPSFNIILIKKREVLSRIGSTFANGKMLSSVSLAFFNCNSFALSSVMKLIVDPVSKNAFAPITPVPVPDKTLISVFINKILAFSFAIEFTGSTFSGAS
ncbi:unnamed protein product [Meloidogyne enterolobii]|uniref:Uncharacterized protein n=1 Tax=Meloidogyne enterolobii TaxID=390850 RepID=A0ACB0ZLK3_MELEN